MNRNRRLPTLWTAVLVAAAQIGCDAALTPAEMRAKAMAEIGKDASITAAVFVSATRSCQVVGESDIERCAQLKSSLISEQAAQVTANLAVDVTKAYWKKCQADFGQDYCNELIQRAVAIEYRKPRTSQ